MVGTDMRIPFRVWASLKLERSDSHHTERILLEVQSNHGLTITISGLIASRGILSGFDTKAFLCFGDTSPPMNTFMVVESIN